MSRSDQYVGLTQEARNFLDELVNKEGTVKCLYKMAHQAFNTEPLMGWLIVTKDGTIYKEIMQVVPWSSGPMYFTCLQEEEAGYKKPIFKWKLDNSLLDRGLEYDMEKGTFYV